MNHLCSKSDVELLAVLVGPVSARKAIRRSGGSLSAVLNDVPRQEIHDRACNRLMAAKELVRRSLSETLKERDCLSAPDAVRSYLKVALTGRDHEVFMVLFLDAQHRVLAAEEMFHGTLTQTSVYPREVVKRSLTHNAAAVILAHNHPSGVAEPSRADELLTRSLREALVLVDVRVLDHFVVGGNAILSFAERGLL